MATTPVPATGPITATPWGMEEDGTTVVFVRCHTHFGFINKRPGGSVGKAKHTPAQRGGHFETEATRLIVVCVVVVCVVVISWLQHQRIRFVPAPVGTNQHRVGPNIRVCLDWANNSTYRRAGPNQPTQLIDVPDPAFVRSGPLQHPAGPISVRSATSIRHIWPPWSVGRCRPLSCLGTSTGRRHTSRRQETHTHALSLSLSCPSIYPRGEGGEPVDCCLALANDAIVGGTVPNLSCVSFCFLSFPCVSFRCCCG